MERNSSIVDATIRYAPQDVKDTCRSIVWKNRITTLAEDVQSECVALWPRALVHKRGQEISEIYYAVREAMVKVV